MMLANVVKLRPEVTIDFARRVAVIADFTRLPGVGVAYAELLEAAGLDLRQLHSAEPTEVLYLLDSLRGAKGLTDSRPSLERVERWCAAARRLAPLVSR
jgi:hypothetical protein